MACLDHSGARATPAGDPLDPIQIMTSAKNLPTTEFVDYTFVFN